MVWDIDRYELSNEQRDPRTRLLYSLLAHRMSADRRCDEDHMSTARQCIFDFTE